MKSPSREKWLIMISGKGSNLQNVLEYPEDLQVQWVVSSRKKAPGIRKARRFGCHVEVLPAGELQSSTLEIVFKKRKFGQTFLLGFMRILPAEFLQKPWAKIFNLHPSLLPLFPGKDAFERSIRENAPLGVTIHEVNERVDEGRAWVKHKIRKTSDKDIDLWRSLNLTERRAVVSFMLKTK